MTHQSDLVAALALVVLAISGLGLWVRRMHENKPVKAHQIIVIPHAPELAATAVLQNLLAIRGTRLEGLTPYRSVLILRRRPPWAVLAALWLFPVGLFFLMVKDEVRLEVAMYASQSGTVVRLSGPTEAHLLRRAKAAVMGLPGAREGLDRTPMLTY